MKAHILSTEKVTVHRSGWLFFSGRHQLSGLERARFSSCSQGRPLVFLERTAGSGREGCPKAKQAPALRNGRALLALR